MSKNIWLNSTVVRSRLVVPTHGRGMGDVCPNAASSGYAAAGTVKRHMTDAFQATTPGSAGMPWSPPVT
jgi:hypothetical protein